MGISISPFRAYTGARNTASPSPIRLLGNKAMEQAMEFELHRTHCTGSMTILTAQDEVHGAGGFIG
jgi:hypothetical protein